MAFQTPIQGSIPEYRENNPLLERLDTQDSRIIDLNNRLASIEGSIAQQAATSSTLLSTLGELTATIQNLSAQVAQQANSQPTQPTSSGLNSSENPFIEPISSTRPQEATGICSEFGKELSKKVYTFPEIYRLTGPENFD
jgi:uncharacterized membrane protein YccC